VTTDDIEGILLMAAYYRRQAKFLTSHPGA